MKSCLFLLALATSATSSAIFKRDYATIRSDIALISSNLTALTTAVNAYASIADASPLIAAEGTLESAIKQGTADTKATPSATSAQATTILNDIANLIPIIVDTLNAVTNKKAVFTSSGVEGIVTGDIQTLQGETDDFANALIAIAPAAQQAAAVAAKNCIDAAFNATLAGNQASAACATSTSSSSTSALPTSTKSSSTSVVAPTSTKSSSTIVVTPTTTPSSTKPTSTPVPTTSLPGSTVTKTVTLPGSTVTVAGPVTTATSTKTVTVTVGGGATSTCPSLAKCTKLSSPLDFLAIIEAEIKGASICFT